MRFGIPTIVVGHKTNSVFYTEFDPATNVYKADLYTGAVYKLVAAPPHAPASPASTPAKPWPADTEREYGGSRLLPALTVKPNPNAAPQAGNLVQPENKGQMMERRLAARITVILYTSTSRPAKRKTSSTQPTGSATCSSRPLSQP